MVEAKPVFASVIFWLPPVEKVKELMLKVAVVALAPLALNEPDMFERLCEKGRLTTVGAGGGGSSTTGCGSGRSTRLTMITWGVGVPVMLLAALERAALEAVSELELLAEELVEEDEVTIGEAPPPPLPCGPKVLTTIWRINI